MPRGGKRKMKCKVCSKRITPLNKFYKKYGKGISYIPKKGKIETGLIFCSWDCMEKYKGETPMTKCKLCGMDRYCTCICGICIKCIEIHTHNEAKRLVKEKEKRQEEAKGK